MSSLPRCTACGKVQWHCTRFGCTPPVYQVLRPEARALLSAEALELGWEHTIARSATWLRTGRTRAALAFLDKARCVIGLHYYVSGRGAGSELYIATQPLDAANFTKGIRV